MKKKKKSFSERKMPQARKSILQNLHPVPVHKYPDLQHNLNSEVTEPHHFLQCHSQEFSACWSQLSELLGMGLFILSQLLHRFMCSSGESKGDDLGLKFLYAFIFVFITFSVFPQLAFSLIPKVRVASS